MLNELLPNFNPSLYTPHKVLLAGVVGSHAYGLATEHSDVDLRGVFIIPTSKLVQVYFDNDSLHTEGHEPNDHSFSELLKYLEEAAKCNPNSVDLLYLEEYLLVDPLGAQLVGIREAFLSTRARDSYAGYAWSQYERVLRRKEDFYSEDHKGRYSKMVRHCFRLMSQGKELLQTGKLTVKVEDREYLFWVGEQTPERLENMFLEAWTELKNIDSILPATPDLDTINTFIMEARKSNWEESKDL